MIILNESKRDDLLLPYVELLNAKGIKCTTGILKKWLLRHLTENGGLRNLSLGSNFYLAGAARYYFNGDLTTNKNLDVFNNGNENNDVWKTDICERLNALILILRNSVVDSIGETFEQPEDFGELPIAKLLRKYGAKINKELGIETVKKSKNKEDVVDTLNRDASVGNNYTFDILYSFNDAKRYYNATNPGAWCITYGEGHYNSYKRRLGIHYVILRKNGWEDTPRVKGPDWTSQKPQDEYGCSLIALLQSNTNGEPVYITSRWNHGHHSDNSNCEADHAFTKEEFFQKTGINDNDLQRIFEIWKKDNTEGKRKGSTKNPEEKATALRSLRDLKYRQMRINGGENPDFALIDRLHDMSNEEYARIISERKTILLGNGKPSSSIIIYQVALEGNYYFVLVDRGKILFETLTPSDSYRQQSWWGKTFDYSNNTNGSEYSWLKNAIVYRRGENSFMIYCINYRKFLDIGGVTKFKYLNNVSKYGTENPVYYEMKLSNNQVALVDILTNKAIRLPNGEYWSESIKWEGKNGYYGRTVKPKLVSGDVKYLVFNYDSAAGTVYFYDTTKHRFMDVDLSDFTDKSHMVIKSAKIASDPEIMLVGNDGYIHSENIFYLYKNNKKVSINGIDKFNFYRKFENTNIIALGINTSVDQDIYKMIYYYWLSDIQSFIEINGEPFKLKESYMRRINNGQCFYIKIFDNPNGDYYNDLYAVYCTENNTLLKNPLTNDILFNPKFYEICNADKNDYVSHKYTENEEVIEKHFPIDYLIKNYSVSCVEPGSAPLIYSDEKENSIMGEPMLSTVNENKLFNSEEAKYLVKETIRRILENKQNELISYHGTTSLFNNFDMSFVGSGEGSQVYGWGVYLTDVKDTGRWYAATIAIKNSNNDRSNTFRSVYKKIESVLNRVRGINEKNFLKYKEMIIEKLYNKKESSSGERVKQEFDMAINYIKNCIDFNDYLNKYNELAHKAATPYKRYVYEVDIPDNGYIDWNNSDPEFIRDIFNKISTKFDTSHVDINSVKYFGDMFEKLRGWTHKPNGSEIIPQKSLSLFLYSLGYNGIKVPTGNKKGGDGRGSNYVVFNDKDVKIINKTDMTGKENF